MNFCLVENLVEDCTIRVSFRKFVHLVSRCDSNRLFFFKRVQHEHPYFSRQEDPREEHDNVDDFVGD